MTHPFTDEQLRIILEAALWCINNDRQRDNLGIQLDLCDDDLRALGGEIEAHLDSLD